MSRLDGITVAVLTVSDRVATETRDDAGGSALCELLEGAGAELVSRAVVADEREPVAAALALYDMVKGVQRDVRDEDLRLLAKRGGRSGDYQAT